MGQYHKVYNLDKKQYINGHDIDNGLKLMEQIGWPKSTSSAVWLLLGVSNGRGGGDAVDHPLIGQWGGDRIAVIGDYFEKDDIEGFDFEELEEYENISGNVMDMLNTVFDE